MLKSIDNLIKMIRGGFVTLAPATSRYGKSFYFWLRISKLLAGGRSQSTISDVAVTNASGFFIP